MFRLPFFSVFGKRVRKEVGEKVRICLLLNKLHPTLNKILNVLTSKTPLFLNSLISLDSRRRTEEVRGSKGIDGSIQKVY